jgi:hypothetical protein
MIRHSASLESDESGRNKWLHTKGGNPLLTLTRHVTFEMRQNCGHFGDFTTKADEYFIQFKSDLSTSCPSSKKH